MGVCSKKRMQGLNWRKTFAVLDTVKSLAVLIQEEIHIAEVIYSNIAIYEEVIYIALWECVMPSAFIIQLSTLPSQSIVQPLLL